MTPQPPKPPPPRPPKPGTVEEYLAGLAVDRRARIQAMRETIAAAAPGAVETIAYDMPAFRLDGRFLVSFAAYKQHDSLFPATDGVVEALGDDVRPYLAGRGTIRFPAKQPLPLGLIARILAVRVAEHGGSGS
jgi:uncharacterized protein YdhG (YjbR/CyaY superfamily)